MDDIVRAALRKWPNVPHCHGWLALDARGDWYMRDDAAQRAGPFPRIKGSRIEHAALIGFIGRNYGRDERGAWFFQNGPQRVYVELEVAPWIFRMASGAGVGVESHTGRSALAARASVDEHGRLFLHTEIGLGLVHTLDMHRAADWITDGRLGVDDRSYADLVAEAGFVARPRPADGLGAAAAGVTSPN